MKHTTQTDLHWIFFSIHVVNSIDSSFVIESVVLLDSSRPRTRTVLFNMRELALYSILLTIFHDYQLRYECAVSCEQPCAV